MIFLTLEQLLELHVLVIAQNGGSDGLRDLGRLEAVIATQTQNVFGEELYSSLYEKAAALIRGIIGDHPFVDGNMCTAVLAGLTLLRINQLGFKAKHGEIEDFAVQIATQRIVVPIIAEWLQIRTN